MTSDDAFGVTGGMNSGSPSHERETGSARHEASRRHAEGPARAFPAPTLRGYQAAAVEAIRRRFLAGDRSTMIELPTGAGKTLIFSEVVRRALAKGKRALVLAGRKELLSQARAKLRAAGVEAALEQGPNRAGDARAVVASVATLRGKRLENWPADTFDLVIIDECHHAVADTYQAILARFSSARVIGCTATGDRADGLGMGRAFASVAYRYTIREAIADRWLVPIVARRVRLAVDLDAISTTAGDFDKGELAHAMTDPTVITASADAMLANLGTRQTIAFCVDIAHAEALAAALNTLRPGCARAVSGRSTDKEREAAAVDLAAGRYQIATNAALWVEGFDLPVVSGIVMAKPTRSRAVFVQAAGRGLRLAEGKADCYLLDLSGSTRKHRLIGPADILADRLTDEEAQLAAEAMEGEPIDPSVAIEQARAAAAEHLKLGVRRWVIEEVGDLLGESIEPEGRDGGDLATTAQRDAVRRAGFDDVPIALTRAQASRILDLVRRRREEGRATVPQVRLLRRLGVDGAEWLSFVAATRTIDELVAERRRWQEAMR